MIKRRYVLVLFAGISLTEKGLLYRWSAGYLRFSIVGHEARTVRILSDYVTFGINSIIKIPTNHQEQINEMRRSIVDLLLFRFNGQRNVRCCTSANYFIYTS